ncbi:unnamed protein product [Absidia cylindrospora]
MWKDAQNNEEIASSSNRVAKTFDERIQSIHVSSSLRANVILVNENGFIDLVSKDLDRFTANYKAESVEHVLWSTVFVTSSSHVRPCCIPNSMLPANSTVVVTICKRKDLDNYTVKLHYINEERRSIIVAAEIDLKLKNKPVAFTFDSTLGIFTVLESNGTWTINHLALEHRPSNKIGAYLEQRSNIMFKNYQIYDEKLGKVASLAPLNDNFVALVAPRVFAKGSKVYEHVLSVWDVKYGTLQAEQVIKLSEKKFSNGNCVCKINVLRNSHIAVAISSIHTKTTETGKSSKKIIENTSIVTLCPYYNRPMSLMGAMNKMKSTAAFLDIDMNSLSDKDNIGLTRSGQGAIGRNISFGIDDQNALEEWTTQLNADQASETKLLASLMDETISKNDFNAKFMERVRIDISSLDKELETVSNGTQNLDNDQIICSKAYSEFGKNKRKNKLSSQLVSIVVDRIFSKKNGKPDMALWSPTILLYLMAKRQLRSGYIDGGLMNGLIDRQAWYLLPMALESVIDIPETDLMVLINTLVAMTRENPSVWNQKFATYLKLVVEAPRNDIFMHQALKRLTVDELPMVLNTITGWLLGKDNSSEVIKLNKTSSRQLEKRNNIIEFTSALLDIHFPTLILEQSLHETISELQVALISLSQNVEDLENLQTVVAPFERIQKLHKKQDVKQSSNKSQRKKASQLGHMHARYGGEEGVPVYRVEMFQF